MKIENLIRRGVMGLAAGCMLLGSVLFVSAQERIERRTPDDNQTMYLRQHADPAYTGNKKADPANLLLVKQTLADAKAVSKNTTIDSLFYDAQVPGEDIIGVFPGTVYVYNLDDQSDYYVAMIDTMHQDGNADALEAVFALNDESGTLIEGCHYDADTGIAYIPKTAYLDASGEKEVPLKIQAQLLQAYHGGNTTPVEVVLEGEENRSGDSSDKGESFVIESPTLEVVTKISLTETAKEQASRGRLVVTANGGLEPLEGCVYDENAGELLVPISPVNLSSVEVEIKKETILSKMKSMLFDMSKVYAMTAGELESLPITPIDFTGVAEGTIFEGTFTCEYGVGAGDSKDSYNYLYGYRGMVTEADLQATFNAIYDFNTSLDLNNLAHASGLCPFAVTIQEDMAAGVGGFLKINWNELQGDYPLALQCGHISNALQTTGVPPNVHGKVRVFTIDEDAGYAIIGLITETVYTQSAAGIYKVPLVVRPKYGAVELRKASSDSSVTEGNDCYSLAGARYGLYLDGRGDAPVAELVTDENGYAKAEGILAGHYWLKELDAPKGFTIDSRSHGITVQEDQTITAEVEDAYQYNPVEIILRKENTGGAQGIVPSLEGAEFTIKYYKGIYDENPAQQGIAPERMWVMRTDTQGEAKLNEEYKVSGDAFYGLSDGRAFFPAGTITVQETKAPKGYKRNEQVFVQKIETGGSDREVMDLYHAPVIPEAPERMKIHLKKIDKETGGKPQGTATLEGAVYEIKDINGNVADTLRTDANGEAVSRDLYIGQYTVCETEASRGFLIDDTVHMINGETGQAVYDVVSEETPQKGVIELCKEDSETGTAQGSASLEGAVYEVTDSGGTLVQTLVTGAGGIVKSQELPFGNYILKEKTAAPGYLIDHTEYTVELSPENAADRVFVKTVTVKEQIKRGDLELIKISGGDTDHQRLAGIPFKITAKSTEESHVIITDVNGYASTGAEWNPHTQNTNEGKTADDGVWFGGGEPNNEMGALPYDTYVIEEMVCEANTDYALIEPFEITIYKDGNVVNMGTLTDVKPPEPLTPLIGTTAHSQQYTKELELGEKIPLIDAVRFENLTPGEEYVMIGTVYDKESGNPLEENGEIITASASFTPTVSAGTVSVVFTLNTMVLEGKELVVFESLMQGEKELAVHADLADEGQTVKVKEQPPEEQPPEEQPPEEPPKEEPPKEETPPEEPPKEETPPEEPPKEETPPEEPPKEETPPEKVIPPKTEEVPPEEIIPPKKEEMPPSVQEPPKEEKKAEVPEVTKAARTGDRDNVRMLGWLVLLSVAFCVIIKAGFRKIG